MPDLIRLVHSNVYSKKFIVQEFHKFIDGELSVFKITQKLGEIAEYKKPSWLVKDTVLEKYYPGGTVDKADAWSYALEVPVGKEKEVAPPVESPVTTPVRPKSAISRFFVAKPKTPTTANAKSEDNKSKEEKKEKERREGK